MLMLINNFLTQLRKPSTQDISVSNTQGKRQKSTLLSVYLIWYHKVLSIAAIKAKVFQCLVLFDQQPKIPIFNFTVV